MNKKHVFMAILLGWLIAIALPPARVFSYLRPSNG
jgi:hypothetical protein